MEETGMDLGIGLIMGDAGDEEWLVYGITIFACSDPRFRLCLMSELKSHSTRYPIVWVFPESRLQKRV